MIEIKNVSYSYKTMNGIQPALCNISETIKDGIITAIIGHTGSGKSTMSEIISGLTKPQSGSVLYNNKPVSVSQTGIIFQYPEYQLFEDTVYNDIAFGPKNLGLKDKELEKRVLDSAELTGISEKMLKKSPFELSGGQKRLAAIAGILAMNPNILILDEPAAGLDPQGKNHIFEIIKRLISENPQMTIIFVTHSMEDAAEYADDIILLKDGRVMYHSSPEELFLQHRLLKECRLDIPEMTKLSLMLLENGIDIGNTSTVNDAADKIINYAKEHNYAF